MRNDRKLVAGLILGLSIFLGASAQPPTTSQTVEIKKTEAKPAATPKEANPLAIPAKKTNRDPFVKGEAAPVKLSNQANTGAVKVAAASPKDKGKAGPAKAAVPAPVIPPPQVVVHGIVVSGSGNQAILKSPNNTYIVHAGDKLGDYRVASVDTKQVVFTFKDKSFKMKLEEEFGGIGTPAGGSSGKKK